ncbi:MATE family efflux transporter [Bacillus cereus]
MLRYILLKIDIGKEGTDMAAIQAKNGPTEKLSLFLLTWPIFLEVFLFMLMGIADTFMLSALSDDAVSGVGAANQYLHIAILVLECFQQSKNTEKCNAKYRGEQLDMEPLRA